MQRHDIDALCQHILGKPFADTYLYKKLAQLPLMRPEGPWLAGGAIRRMLANIGLSKGDLDIFFTGPDQFEAFQHAMFQMRPEWRSEVNDWDVKWRNTGAPNYWFDVIHLQALKFNFCPTPEALLADFDFTVCQLAYDGHELICGDHTLWDMASWRLSLVKCKSARKTLRRARKYEGFGYKGNIVKMLEPIAKAQQNENEEDSYL